MGDVRERDLHSARIGRERAETARKCLPSLYRAATGTKRYSRAREEREQREKDRVIDRVAETRRREKEEKTGEARIDPIKYSRS